MSEGIRTHDFIGYTTGAVPATGTPSGVHPMDFIGYTVGQPPTAPASAGFIGLLDFTGYPTSAPRFTSTTRARGGYKPAARTIDDDEIILMI